MRIPEDTQQSLEEADEILPSQPTSPTVKAKVFLEGNKKSFEVQLSQDVLPKLKDLEAEEQLEAQRLSPRGNEFQSKDYMLKSSLFNPQDNIKPIKNYYYNDRGVMSREGRKKKAYGIKSYIQSVSNDLVLAQLTQEYGGKAVQILSDLHDKHMDTDKVIEEYQSFRLKQYPPDLDSSRLAMASGDQQLLDD